MKAVVFDRYGTPEVLLVRDVPVPEPRPNEVRVAVHAVSLNDWDHGALHGQPFVNRAIFGWLRPRPQRRILGSDVSGCVVAVGSSVTAWRVGDAVFGDLSGTWGGFAEQVCARADALASKPPALTHVQAAALPQAGLLALQGLDVAGLERGHRLLINGAGGGVGTFAIQIAKARGAQVTAVDAPHKLALLRTLGADAVVDYTAEDFARGGRRYDAILDAKSTRSVRACMRGLRPGGVYVTVGGDTVRLLQVFAFGRIAGRHGGRRAVVLALRINDGLERLAALCDAGTLRPVIDRIYPLDAVPDAFRRFGAALQQGKIVIDVAGDGSSAASGDDIGETVGAAVAAD